MASVPANSPRGRSVAAMPQLDEADVPALECDNYRLLIFGIMLAALLQILDSTIANVAIPHMQSSLGATADTINWVLTSYIVASAVAMPITGWLAERIGARRLFIGSVAAFIVASMLCGAAQNLTQMVLFRALQGVAGAFIAPLSQSAMIDVTRPSRQAQIMSLWGMGVMVGPIFGPILGGWLTENWSWRWVFYVNLPLGVISLVIMMAELPGREAARRKFDLTGFALVGIALASVQLMLDRGNHVDWFDSIETWIYLGVALSTTWMAVIHLATSENPIFRQELIYDPNFLLALAFMIVVGVVMMATIALLPPMLQHLFNYSVIDTGMTLMPRGVGTLISMQLSGILVRRGFDARTLVACGFALAGASLWMMSGWSLDVDYWNIVVSGFIQGLGMGMVFIPINASAFATLPPHLRTEGASLLNLFRSIGASVGISVVSTLLARNIQVAHQDLASHMNSASIAGLDFTTVDRFQVMGDVALRMADGIVNREAAMIAYVDDFYAMMWVTLAAIPLCILLRPPQTKGMPQQPVSDH